MGAVSRRSQGGLARSGRNVHGPRHRGACDERGERALDVRQFVDAHEIPGSVVADEVANHRKRPDVRYREVLAYDPRASREPLLEIVEQAARLGHVTIPRPLVLVLLAGKLMEEAYLAEE